MIIAIHRQYARVHQLIQNAQNDRRFDRLRDNFSFSGLFFIAKIVFLYKCMPSLQMGCSNHSNATEWLPGHE